MPAYASAMAPYPVRGRLDPKLGRWRWLVKSVRRRPRLVPCSGSPLLCLRSPQAGASCPQVATAGDIFDFKVGVFAVDSMRRMNGTLLASRKG